ncbi:MAG: ABC transporter ATP-binding protein [Flavobacteriales bacterium]|nr:ABC transporter ATP-binding protein [Flavobacteriales bacterium]
MEKETVIKVEQLAKSFGSFQAVKDVSFTVGRGDVFGFLGPNGAGKSTTIRCLLSLIKPNAGKIELFGKSYANNRSEILSKIGSIIEKPDFYKYLSAQKNLEIFARISGASVSKSQIGEMLEFVGLAGRGGDKIGGFSHGMKQRLGIAQTLLHQPDLIILDEPTTGLDPQGIVEIRNLILRLKNEQNKTILLSSHQLSEIELIANRMVIINKGKSIVEGEVQDLLNAQELVVHLEIDAVAQAKQVISNHFSTAHFVGETANELEVAIEKNQVPLLNKALIENGISVFALEPKRKLEDFFMKIVQS